MMSSYPSKSIDSGYSQGVECHAPGCKCKPCMEIEYDHEKEPNVSYVDEEWDPGSTSSLSGGITTITNLVEEGDIGNQCSPSRSIFQVVGDIDSPSLKTRSTTHENGSHLGSFASYYNMQKNGPFIPDTHIRQDQIFKHQDDLGGFCDQAEVVNVDSDLSTEGRGSSLSSITNEFFPRFNGNGMFINYGKRSLATTKYSSSSPQSTPQSSREKSIQSPKNKIQLYSSKKKKRQKNNLVNGSPWYSASRIELQPQHHHIDINENVKISQEGFRINPPREVLLTPHHFDDKLSFPTPSPSPSIISSNGVSQMFTNELRERYRRSIYRSYGHHYRRFINSSCAKKSVVLCSCLALIIGVVATTAVILSKQGSIRHSPGTNAMTINNDMMLPSSTVGDDGTLPVVCCVDGYEGLDQSPVESTEEAGQIEEDSFDAGVIDPGEGTRVDDDIHSPSTPTLPPPSSTTYPWLSAEEIHEKDSSSPEEEVSFSVSNVDEPSPEAGSPTPAPITYSPAWNLLANLSTPRPTTSPPTPRPTPAPVRTNEPSRRPVNIPTREPTIRPSRFPTMRPSTRRPTTPSPTDSPNNFPDLVVVGNDGDQDVFPLVECEGDCDTDDDCAGNLECFKRNQFENIPGCSGRGEPGTDYCIVSDPEIGFLTPLPTISPTASPVSSEPTISPSLSPVTARPTRKPSRSPVTSNPTNSPSLSPVTSEPTPNQSLSPVSSEPTPNRSLSPVSSEPTSKPSSTPVSQEPTSSAPTTSNPVTVSPTVSNISLELSCIRMNLIPHLYTM